MKLLAFLSCLGDPVHPPAPRRRQEPRPPTSTAPGDGGRRRRAPNSIAWRPSLGSIHENGKAAAGPAGRTVKSGKQPAGKKRSRAEIGSRHGRDRFGQSATVASVPAFNPTAFLF